MIEPAVREIVIYQGMDWYWPQRLKSSGVLLDTTGYGARLTVRQTDWDGAVMVAASTDNGQLVTGYTPAVWESGVSYALGQRVIPADGPNGSIYACIQAGSDTTEPDWPTTIGDSTTSIDPIALFQCVATDETVANLVVSLTAGQTAALDDWGHGVWDLELVYPFGQVQRLFHGVARLSREVSYT
jgi:hypothetical protein